MGTATKVWNPKQSKSKATATAKASAKGGIAGGGLVTLILWIIRMRFPNLDIPPEILATIIGLVTAAGGSIWGWLETFLKDRKKHGGNLSNGPLPYAGMLLLVFLPALMAGGCMTTINPDTGEEQTQLDPVALDLWLTVAEEAYMEWLEYSADEDVDPETLLAQKEAHRQKIEKFKRLLVRSLSRLPADDPERQRIEEERGLVPIEEQNETASAKVGPAEPSEIKLPNGDLVYWDPVYGWVGIDLPTE